MTWAEFVESCYVAARLWGHSWQDFMSLPIPLWWLEFDAQVKQSKRTEAEMKKHQRGLGGVSEADWDKARAAHKAKREKWLKAKDSIQR